MTEFNHLCWYGKQKTVKLEKSHHWNELRIFTHMFYIKRNLSAIKRNRKQTMMQLIMQWLLRLNIHLRIIITCMHLISIEMTDLWKLLAIVVTPSVHAARWANFSLKITVYWWKQYVEFYKFLASYTSHLYDSCIHFHCIDDDVWAQKRT